MTFRKSVVAVALSCGALVALPGPALQAQAWNYPAFQTPTIARNELNFAVADADLWGTSFIFQWRKAMASRSQLSLDAGFADPGGPNSDSYMVLGGQYGYQLARANRDLPLDFMLTFGLNGAFGDPTNFFRVPVGVSLGHRFPLEGRLAITPYAHPRVSFDRCSECGNGGDSDIGLKFDVGANFEFTPQLAMRVAGGFGGSDYFDDSTFGLSLAWTPGYARPRR